MQITDAAITDALIREIKTGHKLKVAVEKQREIAAAQEAKGMKGKTVAALGKCVATIPAFEYFQLRQKYGEEEIQSREFVRDFNKRFPHLSPNRA